MPPLGYFNGNRRRIENFVRHYAMIYDILYYRIFYSTTNPPHFKTAVVRVYLLRFALFLAGATFAFLGLLDGNTLKKLSMRD